MGALSDADFVLGLLTALGLGSAIGLERQYRQRLAGLRTNALVSTGAALFVMLSDLYPDGTNIDRTRIAAQVVSGIGFLGAGVIMREGLTVRGLNTAATLWCSAAVGALAGHGFLFKSTIGALGIILANLILRPVAQRINRVPLDPREEDISYLIRIVCRSEEESYIRRHILQVVGPSPLVLRSLHSEAMSDTGKVEITAGINSHGKNDSLLEQTIGRLCLERCVSAITWKNSKEEIA